MGTAHSFRLPLPRRRRRGQSAATDWRQPLGQRQGAIRGDRRRPAAHAGARPGRGAAAAAATRWRSCRRSRPRRSRATALQGAVPRSPAVEAGWPGRGRGVAIVGNRSAGVEVLGLGGGDRRQPLGLVAAAMPRRSPAACRSCSCWCSAWSRPRRRGDRRQPLGRRRGLAAVDSSRDAAAIAGGLPLMLMLELGLVEAAAAAATATSATRWRSCRRSRPRRSRATGGDCRQPLGRRRGLVEAAVDSRRDAPARRRRPAAHAVGTRPGRGRGGVAIGGNRSTGSRPGRGGDRRQPLGRRRGLVDRRRPAAHAGARPGRGAAAAAATRWRSCRRSRPRRSRATALQGAVPRSPAVEAGWPGRGRGVAIVGNRSAGVEVLGLGGGDRRQPLGLVAAAMPRRSPAACRSCSCWCSAWSRPRRSRATPRQSTATSATRWRSCRRSRPRRSRATASRCRGDRRQPLGRQRSGVGTAHSFRLPLPAAGVEASPRRPIGGNRSASVKARSAAIAGGLPLMLVLGLVEAPRRPRRRAGEVAGGRGLGDHEQPLFEARCRGRRRSRPAGLVAAAAWRSSATARPASRCSAWAAAIVGNRSAWSRRRCRGDRRRPAAHAHAGARPGRGRGGVAIVGNRSAGVAAWQRSIRVAMPRRSPAACRLCSCWSSAWSRPRRPRRRRPRRRAGEAAGGRGLGDHEQPAAIVGNRSAGVAAWSRQRSIRGAMPLHVAGGLPLMLLVLGLVEAAAAWRSAATARPAHRPGRGGDRRQPLGRRRGLVDRRRPAAHAGARPGRGAAAAAATRWRSCRRSRPRRSRATALRGAVPRSPAVEAGWPGRGRGVAIVGNRSAGVEVLGLGGGDRRQPLGLVAAAMPRRSPAACRSCSCWCSAWSRPRR